MSWSLLEIVRLWMLHWKVRMRRYARLDIRCLLAAQEKDIHAQDERRSVCGHNCGVPMSRRGVLRLLVIDPDGWGVRCATDT